MDRGTRVQHSFFWLWGNQANFSLGPHNRCIRYLCLLTCQCCEAWGLIGKVISLSNGRSNPSCPAGGSVARETVQVQTQGIARRRHTGIKKTKKHSLKAPKVRVYDWAWHTHTHTLMQIHICTHCPFNKYSLWLSNTCLWQSVWDSD